MDNRMPLHANGTVPGLHTVSEPPNWRDDAACTHTDPDLFFPIGTTGAAATQIDEAKQICHGPARLPCLAWARGGKLWVCRQIRGRWSPVAAGLGEGEVRCGSTGLIISC